MSALSESCGDLLTGASLTYNAKPEILNPHFLVYADRERDWLALLK